MDIVLLIGRLYVPLKIYEESLCRFAGWLDSVECFTCGYDARAQTVRFEHMHMYAAHIPSHTHLTRNEKELHENGSVRFGCALPFRPLHSSQTIARARKQPKYVWCVCALAGQ